MQEEIWKDINWYEWLYQVSNTWNVKSINYKKMGISHNLTPSRFWNYKGVVLCWKIKMKKYIHRIVMETFIWKSILTVNHIDWNKENNSLSNLEYISQKENNIHARILWLNVNKKWYDNKFSKEIIQLDIWWNEIKKYGSAREASRVLWIPASNIINVCNNKKYNKTAWWFIFKYT